MPATILVVDDDASIRELARLYLVKEGFQVEEASDGPSALAAVRRSKPALLVLDVMLPGMDGFEVCRRLRAEGSQAGVLMLTARGEDVDRIVGLELGADDYLTKPFNPRELAARVKAILRRASRSAAEVGRTWRAGDLEVDVARRQARLAGRELQLTTREFDLLTCLVQHPGLVLSREQLLDLVWGYDYYGTPRTVDVHIAQLREKLAEEGGRIETVRGVGYRLRAQPD